jgi:diguanylate cyclase
MTTNQHDRVLALAKTAMALMSERHVSPTPDNYELFYAYVAGDNPGMALVLGDLIAARRPLPPQLLKELRDRFFGSQRYEAAVHNIGAEISETVASVLTRLEAAERDAVDYGRTLSEATDKFDGAQSPDGMQLLINGLVSATHTMETRTRDLETELQRSSHEVNELRSKLDDVRKETLMDPLTGIANRKGFDSALHEAIAQSRQSNEPMCLLMCDIDHFKAFNDTWGHQTGDQVLRLVAGCLSENVKGRDTAARYGGEEFTVILRNTTSDDAVSVADQIRRHVEGKKLLKKSTGEVLGTISISIGVAFLTPVDTEELLLQRADSCLYAAKGAGRNCVISDTKLHAADNVAAA